MSIFTRTLRLSTTGHPLRSGSAPLVFRGVFDDLTGYGKSSVQIVRVLRAEGIDPDLIPTGLWEPRGWRVADDIRARICRVSTAPTELLYMCPDHVGTKGRRTIHYTMWESSSLPPDIVRNLNAQDRLIVPCHWNRDCFQKLGVTVPIHVIPLWLDAQSYSPTPMRMDGPTVFGCGGQMAHGGVRKGLEESIETFLWTFRGNANVRMEVKVMPTCPLPDCSDPRVKIIREGYSSRQMAQWYAGLTAYLSMARAEGFGLMPLQSLACGRPVIATVAHGHAEYLNAQNGYPVAYTMEDCSEHPQNWKGIYQGEWFRPERGHAAERMRAVHADREQAREKGILGAAQALRFAPECWSKELVKILSL